MLGLILATVISLNGEWSFRTATGIERTVTVPHTWNVEKDTAEYRGKATYARELGDVSADRGKTFRLYFNAVYHTAKVSVNGREIGVHVGGYTPFSFDLTRALDFAAGAKNTLTVEVDNAPSELNFPFQMKYDWAADGGIYRPVELRVTDGPGIRYVHVSPSATGDVQVETKLWDGTVKRSSFRVEDARPWHFDNPRLYVHTEKAGGDERTVRYGFRDFRVDGTAFVFNGEKVRLPGLETMPGSNPKYGMAEDAAYQRKVMRMLRDANSVITRFHWCQDEATYDACDEIGLLVQDELSWWQKPERLSREQKELAKRLIAEMIEAHYNHPSIVMWCLSNEVIGNGDDLVELAAFVRSLDPTRPVITVSNETHDRLSKSACYRLDLPTWNDYTGSWYYSGNREKLPELLERIHADAPDRPLFITEAGVCEPANVGGDSRRVDDMIYHLREWQRRPWIPGYIYFCLNDYRTDIGEEGFGADRIRRHGLTDKRLNPKPSYGVFTRLASPFDVTEVKAMDNNRRVRFTLKVRDTIPCYTVRGYLLKYRTANGAEKSVRLPEIKPGADWSIELDDINSEYALEICRADGSVCERY